MSKPNLLELLEAGKKAKRERRKAGYRRQRIKLIVFLGGKCRQCGEDNPDKLEFNHLKERTWIANKTARWVRIARYWREAREGVIELLCGECNKKYGRPVASDAMKMELVDEIEGGEVPF